MNQPNEPLNSQLVDYAVQSLKRGVPEAALQQALRQNQLADNVVAAVITAARDQMSGKTAKPTAAGFGNTAGGAAAPLETSRGADIMQQNKAISLHEPALVTAPAATVVMPTVTATKDPQPAAAPTTPATPATPATLTNPAVPQPMVIQPTVAAGPSLNTAQNPQPVTAGPVQQPRLYTPIANRFSNVAGIVPPAAQVPGPQQLPLSGEYTPRRALADFIRALKANGVAFAFGMGLCGLLSAGILSLAALAVNRWFALPFNFILLKPNHLSIILLGSLACYLLAWTCIVSLLACFVAPTLVSSRSGRYRRLNRCMSYGINRLPTVTLTAAVSVIQTGLPAGLIVAIPALALVLIRQTQTAPYIMPVLYVAAAGWAVNRSSRLALAPLVSLFDRAGFQSAVPRSHELLQGGNRRMVMGLGALGAIAVGVVALATGYTFQRVATQIRWPLLAVIAVLALLSIALLSVVYDFETKRQK